MKLIAIILAGGQSIRMGKDKAEIKIDGERMIERAIRKLRAQSCDIHISASNDYGTGLQLISDLVDGPRGPVAALFAAYCAFGNRADVEGFITVPVDCPDFPDDLVENLKSDRNSQIASGPKRIHPTIGWWLMSDLHRVFKSDLSGGNISLIDLAERVGAKTVFWTSESLFHNINNPEDLNSYLNHKKQLRARSKGLN